MSLNEDHANSRVMPGKKDVLSEIKRRKILLFDDNDKSHVKFQRIKLNQKLDRSKFFMLWLDWKIPVEKQSQEIWQCTYDDNINLLCFALIIF